MELGESRTIRPGDRLSINKSTSRHIGGDEVLLMPMGIFTEWILLLRQSTTKCIAWSPGNPGFVPECKRENAPDFRVVQSAQFSTGLL